MASHRPIHDLPTLETARLILRPFTLEDADDIFAYASDPEVARTTTWEPHQHIGDTHEFLRFVLNRYALGVTDPLGVVHRESGRVIGACGLIPTFPHARGELAYVLGRAWWGRGLMTEAGRALLRYGFTTLGLHRIEARCLVDNVASERVMQRLGMSFEGIQREREFCKGAFVSLKTYAILFPEWDESGQ